MEFSKEYYYSHSQKMFIEEKSKNNNINICNDIWNFLLKFMKKYHYQINFNLLLQDDGDTLIDIENITKRIITELCNMDEKLLDQNKEE